jgi:hypothetical protein
MPLTLTLSGRWRGNFFSPSLEGSLVLSPKRGSDEGEGDLYQFVGIVLYK